MFTAAEVQAILDKGFATLEATTPNGWIVWGEKLANTAIDASSFPAWVAQELNTLLATKQAAAQKALVPG